MSSTRSWWQNPFYHASDSSSKTWLFCRREKALAKQRNELQLFRSPLRTLYHFVAAASSGAVRGSLWLVKNKFTFYVLIPTAAIYLGFKISGMQVFRQRPFIMEIITIAPFLGGYSCLRITFLFLSEQRGVPEVSDLISKTMTIMRHSPLNQKVIAGIKDIAWTQGWEPS